MRRKARALSPIIAIMLVLIIVVVAAVMLYAYFSGFFTPSSQASIAVTATGQTSPDGRTAFITVVIRNSGDTAINITSIVISGVGGETINSGEIYGVTGWTNNGGKFEWNNPATRIQLSKGESITLSIKIEGSNLYAGRSLSVTVTGVDPASGKTVSHTYIFKLQ